MRTIAQISDLHFGRHSSQVAEELLSSLEQNRPDLVAVTGDLTQRARRVEFQAARDFLSRIPARKVIVPGNHDVPLYNLLRRFGAPLARYRHFIAPLNTAENFFLDEEIAVLGIDTTRRLTVKHGRISFDQIANVQRVFGGLPRSVFKILMTHHPLAAPDGASLGGVAHRAPFALKASSQSQVSLLLSGHRHSAGSGHLDVETAGGGAILIVHAGTAISTRTRGGEDNSYNLLQIDQGRVTIDVMARSPGEGFRSGLRSTYRLAGDGWRLDHHLSLT